jgi:hypothetical protein
MLEFSSLSSPHIVLIVGDDGVILAPYGMAKAAPAYFAAADDTNIAAILLHMAKYPTVPVTVLADTLAQDFRRESLPRAGFFDRRRLIERRLKQAFPQAGLSAHIKLRDREILLAAAHENGPVFEWLTRLKASAPQLCLLPVECARMAVRLLPNAIDGWAMLLSRQRTGGFRQIVTYRGDLIFARLTPPLQDDAPASEIAEAVARDIKASLGYLARLGLNDANELDVMLLMPESTHDELRKTVPPLRSLTLLSPRKAALRFALPFVPADNDPYADLLYAGWLVRHRARLPLMLPEARRALRTKKTRKAIRHMATTAAFAASVVIVWQAGGLAYEKFNLRDETAQLQALRLKIDTEETSLPPGESFGLMRQAAARKKLFTEPIATPWSALAELGQGLGAGARLVKLSWHNDEGKKGEALEAEIKLASVLDPDREKTVLRFRQVTEMIAKAMPDYKLTVAHYPFAALPGEALSGGDGANAAVVMTAGVVLKKGKS